MQGIETFSGPRLVGDPECHFALCDEQIPPVLLIVDANYHVLIPPQVSAIVIVLDRHQIRLCRFVPFILPGPLLAAVVVRQRVPILEVYHTTVYRHD